MSAMFRSVSETVSNQVRVSIRAKDLKPPRWDSSDEEIDQASRQAFTAYELAMRRGHHPKLWQAVKGSAFQATYEIRFALQGHGTSVLLVDDDPLVHQIYGHHIERAGWRMIEAVNGREAVELATHDIPQVVIMDMMMPEMDGLAAIRELKQAESTRGIPIIAITANPEYRQIAPQAQALGAVRFLVKPVGTAQLLEAIRLLMPA
jgi:CheY-like chemotaxis protein